MFTRLRTKLTVLYAGLFGVTSLIIAATVFVAVSGNAAKQVRNELEANGQVFDRLWQMRASQLHDSADLLARDFGFRAAVASADTPTINSALDNLRQRLKLDRAFLMDLNGGIVGADVHLSPNERAALWRALDESPHASGILVFDGAPYQAIAAPVQAPDTIGWVVFAAALNDAQMRSFEQLAAIPIQARVFTRNASGAWVAKELGEGEDAAAYAQFLSRPTSEAEPLNLSQGQVIALALPLTQLIAYESHASALVLSYPVALALAPYKTLLALVVAMALLGLALVVLGSWALAKSLSKPISLLDDAAHRLQQGEEIQVAVESSDEIGRLAQSFNAMAAAIKGREQRIRHMALHDPETQLPNRRAFEAVLRKRARSSGGFAVVAIGLDRFSHVRGAIGYELAGGLVRAIGERLANLESKARAARLSADTLGIVLNARDADEALARAFDIQRSLEAPFKGGGLAIDVSTTLGLSFANAQTDVAEMINQASVAIEQAQLARQKAALFDAEAYGDPARNLSLISELYAGIGAGEAFLVHQPKFDIRMGRITGVEALMRWRHPERGMISPDLFITMAEETGHIRRLTEWVLERAITDQAAMRAAGHDLMVSVNVSGRLIGDASFADKALRMIERTGASICFEITETAVIDNPDAALLTLQRYAEAGVKISIDDYGSGLSSLAYLKQIRAHELKIDKTFILSADVSQRDALLVKSTIDLAHSLGMKVTAEGVETPATLALLGGMGCDIAQGYLIGRPMALSDLLPLLVERANGAAASQSLSTIAAPSARAATA